MSKNIRNKTSLGVEIQDGGARLVLLENTTPSPTLVLTQTVRAADDLGRALRSLPKRPSAVTCSISLEHAAVRILDLPPTTDENLERVIALEAEGVVPMGGGDLALSHHVLGMTEQSRLEVMIAAGRLPQVQSALKAVNAAPWVSATVTVTAMALFNALQALRGPAREGVAAILRIEEHASELIVADRTRILLAQALPIGCGLAAPAPAVQPLPVGVGSGFEETEPLSTLAPAVQPWLATLCQQVRYPLQALSYERGIPVERLYVCGRGAAQPDADLQLSERLDLPVAILSPSGTEQRDDARYAVAYGCALQAAGVAPVALNLTPARVTVARESEQRKQTQLSWGALAAALVVAIGLVFWAEIHRKQQEAALLEAQLQKAPTAVKKPPISPNELKKTITDVNEALTTRVSAARALTVLNQALPADTWLAELAYSAETGCVVRGYSTTDRGAQNAQIKLLKQQVFDEVTLDYLNEEKIAKVPVWGFQISCKLRPRDQGSSGRGAFKR